MNIISNNKFETAKRIKTHKKADIPFFSQLLFCIHGEIFFSFKFLTRRVPFRAEPNSLSFRLVYFFFF